MYAKNRCNEQMILNKNILLTKTEKIWNLQMNKMRSSTLQATLK